MTAERGNPEASERGRLAHIDALRGIAAVCVLVQHGLAPLADLFTPTSTARDILSGQWFDLGRFGVLLFFLISGFVIPFSLQGRQSLQKFAIRRFFRLYPPFWLSVVVLALVLGTVNGSHFTARQIAANLTMAPSLFRQAYLSNVYWTLFIELIFYAACASLFVAGQLRNPLVIFAIGMACVALPVAGAVMREAGHPIGIVYLTEHLSFLFAGTLIRMATLREDTRARRLAAILGGACVFAMPLLAAQQQHYFTISTPLGVFLAGVAAFGTFIITNVRPFRPSAGLAWLGAVSYSVYLFHTPAGHLAALAVPGSSPWAAMIQFALMFAITLTFASIIYRVLERPSIDIAKRLTRARRETLAMDVAP